MVTDTAAGTFTDTITGMVTIAGMVMVTGMVTITVTVTVTVTVVITDIFTVHASAYARGILLLKLEG